MGAPEPEKSVHDRLSTALDRLDRLTSHADHPPVDHVDPKTVEEAVGRLKEKVPRQD